MKKWNLPVYTVMHFLVDLSCIFYLMGMVYVQLPGPQMRVYAAVLYNACAFALPMLLGLAADLTGHNALVSLLGCAMIVITYLANPSPWAAAVVIGTGNGLFHIGGGRQVLQDSDHAGTSRFAPAGIFISSGALGVFLGRFLSGNFRHWTFTALWILLALCVLILGYAAFRQWSEKTRSTLSRQKVRPTLLAVSLLIFLVVVIRSYYGFIAVYSWNHGFLTGLLFTLCIVAGKFTGGILADRLGVKTVTILSLAGAGILALWADKIPVIGCISIALFNMTMPLTLTLLADVWKALPGFAFGTLMMALFLGTLPVMVWKVTWLASPAGQLGLCLISLCLLLVAQSPLLARGTRSTDSREGL